MSLSPATARPEIAGTPTRKHAALARYWLTVPSPKGDVAVTAMTASSKMIAAVLFLMSSMIYLPLRGTLSKFANGIGVRDCCPGQTGFRSDGLTGFCVKAKTPGGIPPFGGDPAAGERRVFGGEGETVRNYPSFIMGVSSLNPHFPVWKGGGFSPSSRILSNPWRPTLLRGCRLFSPPDRHFEATS